MKTTKFKFIFISIFVVFIIAGVAAFATYKGGNQAAQIPPITIWGTFPKAVFDNYVIAVNRNLPEQVIVNYTQKSTDVFAGDFVAALARGAGPDAILITADVLLPLEDKLLSIPYASLPERTFLDTYVDGASAYLTPNGVVAMPFTIDPMVMYWNRDMFNAAGIPLPPKYWDELTSLSGKITVKDASGTVSRSAVAMGDFLNVTNARELLGSLILQTGNPVTVRQADGSVVSALTPTMSAGPVAALEFFTQFTNPSSRNYSWNRTWPQSKTAFLSGQLATYFGMASELADIRSKNPNLNFDVAALPQARSGGVKATYARIHGFSLVRASPVSGAAYQIISTLLQPQYIANISKSLYLPSVSRQIIAAEANTDPYITIFGGAALVGKTWVDAGVTESTQVLGSMVQATISGQKSATQAVSDAGRQSDVYLRQAMGL